MKKRSLSIDQIIRHTYAGMIAGRRFPLSECDAFRDAIWREARQGQIEAMMLFFAEALHESEGYDHDGIDRVLRYCDGEMVEFIKKTDEGEWNMDSLRLRVFEKTGYIFAMSKKDQEHVCEMLRNAGYDVSISEPKGEEDEAD